MPPPSRNVSRILRVVGWNLLFIIAGLLLIAASIEACIRLRSPFLDPPLLHWRFVPGVGPLYEPNDELRFTNNMDFWTVQRTNSLGFLDREPDPTHATENCHITIIGDSFVVGTEVHIPEKLQTRLSEIATEEAPNMNVTTSAFGIRDTGQINQLPLYDGYARHLKPDLLILVFVRNDLWGNSALLTGLFSGHSPYHSPRASALIYEDGSIELQSANPKFAEYILTSHTQTKPLSWRARIINSILHVSYFARWIDTRFKVSDNSRGRDDALIARVEQLMQHPQHASFFQGWDILNFEQLGKAIEKQKEAQVSRHAWLSTNFGIAQFKRRADHDGVALMILTAYDSGGKGDPVFEDLSNMAGLMDIPVISQHDYILNRGGSIEENRWRNDFHWTPVGHRWAAEAVWEHMKNEWNGTCPSVEPDPDIDIDWIHVGQHFHTHKGTVFVESFPAFNLDGYESVYKSVVSGHPVARSDWNVHLYTNGLTYTKAPCSADDTEKRFFLHVFPQHQDVLMSDRRSRGFDDLSFDFYERGELFNGKCMVSADLPEYNIESIRTGQFTKGIDSEDAQAWSAYYNFELPDIMDAVNELLQSERKPDIRSDFDVYIDGGRLIYVKDSCNNQDSETPFFLHVFPADEKDLPDGRDESGFDNLDFELTHKGGMHDGNCFAAVDLPEYDIASIRTGQWVRGEGNIWEASIDFTE